MPLLILGSTVNEVNLDTMKNVLALSQGRIRVDISQTDMVRIFKKSKHADVINSSIKIQDLNDQDIKFYKEIVQIGLYKLIEFMLKQNEALLFVQFDSKEQSQ